MAGGKNIAMDNKKTGVVVKDSAMTKEMDSQNDVSVDRENNRKDTELTNELWKEKMFKIHNRELTLKYVDPSGEAAYPQKGYEIRENGNSVDKLELEDGIFVTLKEPVSILETHTGTGDDGKGADPAGSVYFMSPAGEISFDLRKIKGMEDMKAAESVDMDGNPMVNLGMFQIVLNFSADGKMAYGVEISAYLRDSLKVETENGDGTQTRLELVQGEYQKSTVGDGVLKFADSYANTQNGKVNVPQMTELHFQEKKETEKEKGSQGVGTKESYYYKAFASTEVQLQNVKGKNENFSADSAKTKIFGFPVELKEVSINDSTGIMNAGKGNLLWGNTVLELEKLQVTEKRKKINRLKKIRKDRENKEKVLALMVGKTAGLETVEDSGILIANEEIEALDGIGLETESALLKFGNAEVMLRSVHINKELLEAEIAKVQKDDKTIELSKVRVQNGIEMVEAVNGRMQYENRALELSKVKMKDSLLADNVSINLNDGRARLQEKDQKSVEIAENITAPIGEMELKKHKISMFNVKIEKGLDVSALTAVTEIDKFYTIMLSFHHKDGGESTYKSAKIKTRLKFGEREEHKDKKSDASKEEDKNKKIETSKEKKEEIKKAIQFWTFDIGQGEYTGEFSEETKSIGYLATGDIRKIKKQEKPELEKTLESGRMAAKRNLKNGEISEKRDKVLNRLKEKWNKDSKKNKKKAPKIRTVERPQQLIEKDIYTLDGFAKVENATFEFEKDEKGAHVIGEGNVKFQDVPLVYYINGKRKTDKTAFAPEDAVEGVGFTIDSSGNLNAAFETDAEVELNLKGIKGKENSGESTIYTITLGDLSIQNGYLKAGSASMERGIALEQEGFEGEENPLRMTEKAKNFFDCELTGSIVNEGEKNGVKLTAEGIEARLGESKLGKFGVSGFMGFLSGEVDFRSGEILVSAEKSYEPDKLQESFFKVGAKTPGLDASIPTPIPGLGVEFSITPSVGIGGAVGLGVNLGQPFDEYKKDSLELSGVIEGEGHAGVTAGAGVNLGAGYIASMDLKLEGSLTASVGGELKGSTEFEFIKDEKSKKKMQQSKDFTFDGFLEGKLTGALNFNSSVKFLFWKKQLFNIELWKKELGQLKIKGAGKKSKEDKRLLKGWELTSGEFNASWFSKEITKKYFREDYQGEEISTEEFKSLVTGCNEEAQNAWAVLCKLQAQAEDTAFILTESDKKALEVRIEEAKKEVKFKITRYLLALSFQENSLKKQLRTADNELKKAKKTAEEYAQKQGLAKDIFEKAEWGGFKKENYQHQGIPEEIKEDNYAGLKSEDGKVKDRALKEYNKAVGERNKIIKDTEEYNAKKDANAAIDLMITYMLGQVSEQHIARINEKYLLTFKEDLKQKGEDFADSFYRDNTRFMDAVGELEDQNNYYDVLMQRAVYEKRVKAKTREWDEKTYVFERKESDFAFSKKLSKKVKENPKIKMKEILQYVVTEDFTPKEKLEILKKVFGIQATVVKGRITDKSWIRQRGAGLKQGLFNAAGNLFGTMFSETEDSVDASTNEQKKAKMLEEVVKGKNVFDIFQKKEELNKKVEESAKAVESAKENLKIIESEMAWVQTEIKDCEEKLIKAKTKASDAITNKNFKSDAAREAIALYSENYVESVKKVEQKLNENEIKENEKLPKSVSKP